MTEINEWMECKVPSVDMDTGQYRIILWRACFSCLLCNQAHVFTCGFCYLPVLTNNSNSGIFVRGNPEVLEFRFLSFLYSTKIDPDKIHLENICTKKIKRFVHIYAGRWYSLKAKLWMKGSRQYKKYDRTPCLRWLTIIRVFDAFIYF